MDVSLATQSITVGLPHIKFNGFTDDSNAYLKIETKVQGVHIVQNRSKGNWKRSENKVLKKTSSDVRSF